MIGPERREVMESLVPGTEADPGRLVFIHSRPPGPVRGSGYILGVAGTGDQSRVWICTARHILDPLAGQVKRPVLYVNWKLDSRGVAVNESEVENRWSVAMDQDTSTDTLLLSSVDRALVRFCMEKQLYIHDFQKSPGRRRRPRVDDQVLQLGFGDTRMDRPGFWNDGGGRLTRFVPDLFSEKGHRVKRGDLPSAYYEKVFLVEARENDTTMPGDSGGPVFLRRDPGESWTFFGGILGINYYPDRTAPPRPIQNGAITGFDPEFLETFDS